MQFALERGVPAVIGVLGTIRLPYPSRAFDMAHCSRCLIPWSANGEDYLLIKLTVVCLRNCYNVVYYQDIAFVDSIKLVDTFVVLEYNLFLMISTIYGIAGLFSLQMECT